MNKIAGVFAAIVAVASAGAASAADLMTYNITGSTDPFGDVSGSFQLDLTTSKIEDFNFQTPFGQLGGDGGLFIKLPAGIDELTFASLSDGKLNALNLLFDPTTRTLDDTVKIGRRLTLSSDDVCLSLAPNCDGRHAFTADFSGEATVTALPEPAAWAMMLLGLGAIGAGLRTNRRRNALSLTSA